jgi:hypothetical protein
MPIVGMAERDARRFVVGCMTESMMNDATFSRYDGAARL